MERNYDVIVIGGGPGGMSAALTLGRARLATLVLNEETPRNAVSHASHGFYTRDGAAPSELLAVAKAQMSKYPTVEYRVTRATDVQSAEGGFEVTGSDGSVWCAPRVIVATGYTDDLASLGIPGLLEVYGRSVFPCPFCDGFELADRRLAVFVSGMDAEMVGHYLSMIRVLSSSDTTVFTNGQTLDDSARAALESRGIPLVEAAVEQLVSEDGVLREVRTRDGQVFERDAGFLGGNYTRPSSDVLSKLGVPSMKHPIGIEIFEADEGGATSVGGLYTVGDARTGFGAIAGAVGQGARCAQGIVGQVAQERWSDD